MEAINKDLYETLTNLGPAKVAKAAGAGVEKGYDMAVNAKQAAFKQKLEAAGLLSGSDVKALIPTLTNVPDRDFKDDILGPLATVAKAQTVKPGGEPLSDDAANVIASQLDPDGREIFLQTYKTLPGDKASNLAARLRSGDISRGIANTQPERKAAGTALVEANNASVLLKDVEASGVKLRRAAETLGDFSTGLTGQTVAKGKLAVGKYAADPKVSAYLQAVDQELSALARSALGEKGVLNDQDIERVRSSLGNASLPLSQKVAAVDGMMYSAYTKAASKLEQAGKTKEATAYREAAAKFSNGQFKAAGPTNDELPQSSMALTGAKAARLAELRRKAAEGTLR